MCSACKRPISAKTQSSVLYLFSLHVCICICPHSFSHVFCTVVTSLNDHFMNMCSSCMHVAHPGHVLPLYLILLQIGPMAEHCLILETIWMWLSTVLCRCLDIIRIVILHSLNELEIPCFSLNQLWLDSNTLFCEAPHSRSPRTITMLQGNRSHCPASTSLPHFRE